LDRLSFGSDEIVITATARRHVVACPECGQPTRRVHSRYHRTLADLPWHGLRVRLALSVREFFCDTPACPRRIFTERLPTTVAPYARRTTRAAGALDVIGLALGGVGGARLATALRLGTSPSSVLRYVRRISLPTAGAPRAVGIDDWAWRKGMVYGTIVVDLEQGCVLDCQPTSEVALRGSW
jgi:transposase